MGSIIRSLVREILREDAYKEKTGKRFTADIEAVRDTVDEEGYFLHFTEVPKIGVNPMSKYLAGAYFYPNTREIYDGFFRDVQSIYRGAGRAARYVYLVKLKPGLDIVEGAGINERIREALSVAFKPILDAGLVDDDYRKRPAAYMSWHKERHGGLSFADYGTRVKYPTVEELERSGQLEEIRKNVKELYDIYQSLKNRSLMKTADFLRRYNERLRSLMGKFGDFSQGSTSYDWGIAPLKSLDADDVKEHYKDLKELFRTSGGVEPLGAGREPTLDLRRLEASLGVGTGDYRARLGGPKTKMGIARATIERNAVASGVLSYADYVTNGMSSTHMTVDVLNWLYNARTDTTELPLKGGGSTTLGELARAGVSSFESYLGEGAKAVKAAAERRDEVGVNIAICLAAGADGVNDTGVGFKAADVLAGYGGRLGRYEGKQLFLKAPIGNKIEIITMIDRFEGKPDSWVAPGSPTPDAEAGFEKDKSAFDFSDERPAALRNRFRRQTGEKTVTTSFGPKQVKTYAPTERWAGAEEDGSS